MGEQSDEAIGGAVVAVLGLGAMGLPMARRLVGGFEVHGFDVDANRRTLAVAATPRLVGRVAWSSSGSRAGTSCSTAPTTPPARRRSPRPSTTCGRSSPARTTVPARRRP